MLCVRQWARSRRQTRRCTSIVGPATSESCALERSKGYTHPSASRPASHTRSPSRVSSHSQLLFHVLVPRPPRRRFWRPLWPLSRRRAAPRLVGTVRDLRQRLLVPAAARRRAQGRRPARWRVSVRGPRGVGDGPWSHLAEAAGGDDAWAKGGDALAATLSWRTCLCFSPLPFAVQYRVCAALEVALAAGTRHSVCAPCAVCRACVPACTARRRAIWA